MKVDRHRFAQDSPLEEAGFELPVPPERKSCARSGSPAGDPPASLASSGDPRRERSQENGGNGG